MRTVVKKLGNFKEKIITQSKQGKIFGGNANGIPCGTFKNKKG